MPAAGIALGTARGGAPRPDPDAVAFAAASGATDVATLSKFVKGIKTAGLWSNMACWPLRNGQNSTTGSTVFSLGGLGTYNGTAIDSPTRGSNGYGFNGTTQRIDTGTIPISGGGQRTLLVVSNSSTGALNAIASLNPDTPTATNETWGILHFPSNTETLGWDADGANNVKIGNVTAGVFSAIAYGWATARFGFTNGTQTLNGSATAPTTGSPSLLSIGATRVSSPFWEWYYNGTIAFVAIFNTGANTNIYALYKSTLGSGLGLP